MVKHTQLVTTRKPQSASCGNTHTAVPCRKHRPPSQLRRPAASPPGRTARRSSSSTTSRPTPRRSSPRSCPRTRTPSTCAGTASRRPLPTPSTPRPARHLRGPPARHTPHCQRRHLADPVRQTHLRVPHKVCITHTRGG
jgi:hypothetical protein